VGKKWIRNRDWARQPHVKDGPPASLWWYKRPYIQRVVDAYLARASRGRSLADGFRDELLQWLSDLNTYQNKKEWGAPRTYRYWSVPAYAAYKRMKNPATLMKRLRELEKVAKRLFPDSVPSDRKQRASLADNEKEEIRQRYLAGDDAKELAKEFRVPPSVVGHLCKEQKKIRAAERENVQNATTPMSVAQSDSSFSDDPFGS